MTHTNDIPGLTLILGGARSGKSAYAEKLTERVALKRLYAATALKMDTEMAQRVSDHRGRRGPGWSTIEMDDQGVLDLGVQPHVPMLLDCLTLWLSFRFDGSDRWQQDLAALIDAASARPASVVLVSNELGMGLVPPDPATRAFRDAHGKMNQIVAARADHVVFVAAGLPLVLK